jgi:hypothetical protein
MKAWGSRNPTESCEKENISCMKRLWEKEHVNKLMKNALDLATTMGERAS